MSIVTVLTTAALATAVAAAIGSSAARADTVIVVGGTGAADAGYIVAALPSGHDVQVVRYPATVMLPWYEVSVAIGVQQLQLAIDNTSGPTTVVGYSQGARIVGDVMTSPQRDGVSATLVSDPRAAGHGVETMVPGLAGERPAPFTVPVTSVCAVGDGVCDWRPADPLGSIAGYISQHTSYWR